MNNRIDPEDAVLDARDMAEEIEAARQPELVRVCQSALDAQSACNLSGIVKQLARDLDVIWEEARANGKGTEFVNTHPVVRLYIEQTVHLNKCGFLVGENPTDDSYSKAYNFCCDKVEEWRKNQR